MVTLNDILNADNAVLSGDENRAIEARNDMLERLGEYSHEQLAHILSVLAAKIYAENPERFIAWMLGTTQAIRMDSIVGQIDPTIFN